MIFIRSTIFNIAFYLNLIGILIIGIPTLLMPRWGAVGLAKMWGRSSIWLLRVICGTDVEWRGLDKIPPGGLLVAPKHHSIWETFALVPLFPDPVFILKRELMFIPFFGWYCWVGGMIAVDRGARAQSVPKTLARARVAMEEGRQLIIFPEGTRRPAGAPPLYKFGVTRLYEAAGVPCLPVALNSGLFWPRRKFLRYPGTIVVQVLDPIPPGLDPRTFFKALQSSIETATAALLVEGGGEAAIRRVS